MDNPTVAERRSCFQLLAVLICLCAGLARASAAETVIFLNGDQARAAIKREQPEVYADYTAFLSEGHVGQLSPTAPSGDV